jgi:hypothetical protein
MCLRHLAMIAQYLNVLAEWLALLLRIQIPDSNIGPETGYPDLSSSIFSSDPQRNYRN